MEETTKTYCGECIQDFMPGEVVWFARSKKNCFCSSCKTQFETQDWEAKKVPVMDVAQASDLVGKTADLLNQLFAIATENALSISVDDSGRNSVHVIRRYLFFQLFDTYDIRTREYESDYPYEVFTEIDGVEFYTLLRQEDYKKFVLKSA